MATVNLGKVRGSQWYAGESISGVFTEPKVFANSGIAKSYVEDKYLHKGDGNVYTCTKTGEPSVAEWLYLFNIRGPQPDIDNVLTSHEIGRALSANMGRVLNEKIEGAGLYPKSVYPSYTEEVQNITIKFENKATKITVYNDNDLTYEEEFAAEPSGAEQTHTLTIKFGDRFGGKVKKIESSEAIIKSYELAAGGQAKEDVVINIWESMNDVLRMAERTNSVSETVGEVTKTTFAANMNMKIDSVFKKFFPVTHAKATWYSELENKTTYEKIEEVDTLTNELDERMDAAEKSIEGIETQIVEKLEPIESRVGNLEKPTFNSGDSLTPSAFQNVNILESQDTQAGLLNKISTMIGNIRYMWGKMGDTSLDDTVTGSISHINSKLEVNNTPFYFDYQEGKYGFNTDSSRGADTFIPFKSNEVVMENVETATPFTVKRKTKPKAVLVLSRYSTASSCIMYHEDYSTEYYLWANGLNNGQASIGTPAYAVSFNITEENGQFVTTMKVAYNGFAVLVY